MQKRAILIVLDGCGAGAAPDSTFFGDRQTVSTLKNVWDFNNGFNAPTLDRIGFLAAGLIGQKKGAAGRLRPLNQGKDSVTGHWEMMGISIETAFPTYPNGFPKEIVSQFEAEIGRPVIGNIPASGTTIIAELGAQHMSTGHPILYTSADSVFQIAIHEDIVPVETLYEWCRIARNLCSEPHNVQRVIARPFIGQPGNFTRTEHRKDFPVTPPENLIDQFASQHGPVMGIGVVPELFDGRGFVPTKRTQNNPEHWIALQIAMKEDHRFIFANFEDFDMLYGHRSDPKGFAKCLEQFDGFMSELIPQLSNDDLLILTADHGNDPTDLSSDHTREFSPIALVNPNFTEWLGDQDGLARVGEIVKDWLN